MVRVFITYNLKEGVSVEDFIKWAKEVDQPVLTRQPGVIAAEYYAAKGAGKGDPPYDILENIDVESWEAWQKVNKYPDMKPIYEQWLGYCDPDSVSVVYAEKF